MPQLITVLVKAPALVIGTRPGPRTQPCARWPTASLASGWPPAPDLIEPRIPLRWPATNSPHQTMPTRQQDRELSPHAHLLQQPGRGPMPVRGTQGTPLTRGEGGQSLQTTRTGPTTVRPGPRNTRYPKRSCAPVTEAGQGPSAQRGARLRRLLNQKGMKWVCLTLPNSTKAGI